MRSSGNGCLVVFVLGALLAAVTTGMGSRSLSDGEDASNKGAQVSGADGGELRSEDSVYPETGAEAVVLDREADGHFYADAEINGQSIRMLVDTGASAIALSREDARRAGVGISIGMPGVVGQGAGGDVHGEAVSLDRVVLGAMEAEEVMAVVLDGGEMSLLGQSFLSKFESVEIRGDRMVLK